MAYSTRPAAETDFPAIRRLINLTRINPMGLAWERFLVAVDEGGKIIGCGQIKPHGDGTHELASIATLPDWRRNGVASTIIQKLIGEHSGKLFLTCRESMGSFYERFGFREATSDELTPYYRRLKSLVMLLTRLRLTSERLLVMARG